MEVQVATSSADWAVVHHRVTCDYPKRNLRTARSKWKSTL